MPFQFTHAVLGGTFDHLHAGHKRILDFAYHTADHLTIGIVGDSQIDTKGFSDILEPLHIRKESVLSYVQQNDWGKRTTITQLKDIYGPAADNPDYDAIIVTRETKKNAIKINTLRHQNNLKPLSIVTVPLLKGTDNRVIRSTRIREGRINRTGDPYSHLFSKSKELSLPPRLRNLLRKPLGQIIEGDERFTSFTAQKAALSIKRHNPTLLISVGDIVSKSLKKARLPPDVVVIDYRSRRQSLSSRNTVKIKGISNRPGTIQKNAVTKLKQTIDRSLERNTSQRLVIHGEEDLLTLPAILLAPLKSIVVYGQKDFGIVVVPITEQIKRQVVGIIRQFE